MRSMDDHWRAVKRKGLNTYFDRGDSWDGMDQKYGSIRKYFIYRPGLCYNEYIKTTQYNILAFLEVFSALFIPETFKRADIAT